MEYWVLIFGIGCLVGVFIAGLILTLIFASIITACIKAFWDSF